MLENPEVSNDALDLVTVVKGEEEDEDDNDDGEFKGFCVYGKKIIVYGYDGLHIKSLRMLPTHPKQFVPLFGCHPIYI